MQISPFQRQIRAADLPLDKLAANPNVPESEKVAEISRQFEAVLLRHILSNAQKPLLSTLMNSNSGAAGIYKDMLTEKMADQISHSGALGFGKNLQTQLARKAASPEPERQGAEPAAPAAVKKAPLAHGRGFRTSSL